MSTDSEARAIGRMTGAGDDSDWMDQLQRKREPGPRSPFHHVVAPGAGTGTMAVHAGTYEDRVTGAVGTPIFQTTTFKFSDASYDAFFEGVTRDVPIYTRYGNPAQWSVQEKVAALEGAESAMVFSSGMAAIATTVTALTNAGGHIVTSYDVYGGTYNLMRDDMHQLGRDVSFVEPTDVSAIEAAIRDDTQMFLFEGLTNPLMKALPITEIAALARANNILLVIDNTFLTPVCSRPLALGADIVIHSATKYLNGHSDLTAGVASGSRKFVDRIWAQMLRFGGSLEPFSCFLLERGLKTLHLRMRQHAANATAIAAALDRHPGIARVYHPSLPDYDWKPPAAVLCPDGLYGGMVSFEVAGGNPAALKVMDALKLPRVATSLGGVESLVSMPFNTSHSSLTEAQRRLVGIRPGLIRLSCGIEEPDDLIADLEQALDAV